VYLGCQAIPTKKKNKRGKIKEENWQQVQVRLECHEFTVKLDGQISHSSLGFGFGFGHNFSFWLSALGHSWVLL